MKLNQKDLPKAYSKYGAEMGRRSIIPDNMGSPKLNMIKLDWVDGDYDFGVAYFGNTGKDNVYWAKGDGYECFVRARSRAEAKEEVLCLIGNARFYN